MSDKFDDVMCVRKLEQQEYNSFIIDYKSDYLLQICDVTDDNKELVTIKPDGTVIVHEYGSEPEAAKIFWDAIQLYGKTFLQQIQELENKVSELTDENARLKARLDMFNAI